MDFVEPTESWKEVLHMHETPGLYMIHFALDFFDLSLEQLAELVMLYRRGAVIFGCGVTTAAPLF